MTALREREIEGRTRVLAVYVSRPDCITGNAGVQMQRQKFFLIFTNKSWTQRFFVQPSIWAFSYQEESRNARALPLLASDEGQGTEPAGWTD